MSAFAKWKACPVHPLLFGALPSLIVYGRAQFAFTFDEAVNSLIVSEVLVTVFWIVFKLSLKEANKAATASTIAVIGFFLFRCFYHGLTELLRLTDPGWVPGSVGWLYLLAWAGLVALVIAIFIGDKETLFRWRLGVDQRTLTSTLNLVGVFMLLFNVVPIYQQQRELDRIAEQSRLSAARPFELVQFRPASYKPDVYYIIVDAYAHNLTLRDFWKFDNSDFTNYLKQQGFFVVGQAFSNYFGTYPSLGSSLNMMYLSTLNKDGNDIAVPTWLVARLSQHSNTVMLFRRLGYKFVNVCGGGGGDGCDSFPGADVNISYSIDNCFFTGMIMQTPLLATEAYFPLTRSLVAQTKVILDYTLDQAAAVKGPKFVFIHLELPHPPYVFGADGTPKPMGKSPCGDDGTPDDYVDQLQFTNVKVREWLTKLMRLTNRDAVILLQGDHGPWFPVAPAYASEYYNERMRILNAYYLPRLKETGLYDRISPVNSFRLLFDQYFGADLPLLKDRSVCIDRLASAWLGADNNRWVDVTSQLTFDTTAKPGQIYHVPPRKHLP